jgi:hypothetical protein
MNKHEKREATLMGIADGWRTRVINTERHNTILVGLLSREQHETYVAMMKVAMDQ